MVFGIEAVIPVEVRLPSYRVKKFNGVAILENLDFLEERHDQALI